MSSRREWAKFTHFIYSNRPSAADRASLPPREDVPLPTRPPFNAFVGNISFDVNESHLESFFEHPDGVRNIQTFRSFPLKLCLQIKSAKVIRDHAESSRGFGYVEFNTVEGLKEALKKSGTVSSPTPFPAYSDLIFAAIHESQHPRECGRST